MRLFEKKKIGIFDQKQFFKWKIIVENQDEIFL